jgi:hypothetical protein
MTRSPPVSAWSGTINGRSQPGAVAERRRRTRDIRAFTAITGDRNPL